MAPLFRTRTDLVAVDVQVIDRDGSPIQGLTADAYHVTIDGKSRRVVSATLAGSAATQSEAAGSVAEQPTAAAITGPDAPSLDLPPLVLAFDCLSFRPAEEL